MGIKFDKLTDVEKELYSLLVEMWDDYGFVAGTLNALEDDEERKAVISFIKSHDNVTASQITLLAFDIDQRRNVNCRYTN
jgi:hypothetical protein